MAQTGSCDSRPLLDLHKTTEERRAPLRTWANTCMPRERWLLAESEEARGAHCKASPELRWVRRLPVSAEDGIIMDYTEQNDSKLADGQEEAALLQCLHSLPVLCVLGPGLLHRELELAMERMGLVHDPTYAWDIYSDMMVSTFTGAADGDMPLFWERTGVLEGFSSPQHSEESVTLHLCEREAARPLTDATRAILVDWLIQVHEVFHFSEETLYLAVHLLDRALRQIKVSVSNLQLLGLVCLFLAGKKEECLLPEISELCFLMDNCYSKQQLLRMERRVLRGLDLNSSTAPLYFLLLTASIARCTDEVVWMARYLLELSLLESQCAVFLPVQLASAALSLARQVLQEAPTPESETAWCIATSLHVCREPTLTRIIQILAVAVSEVQGRETRASFMKFSSSNTLYVSAHPALQSAPCLLRLGEQALAQRRDSPLNGGRGGETGQYT